MSNQFEELQRLTALEHFDITSQRDNLFKVCQSVIKCLSTHKEADHTCCIAKIKLALAATEEVTIKRKAKK